MHQHKSNYISWCKFSFYFAQKKLLFLFYTLIFTKHPHQFIYSTHLFNKIFIIFPFFIILSLTETHLPQNNSLSLTDLNHHHTNHQILAPTKHSFITLFITSFITSSLQWVPKVDPPLLQLRRLIGASFSSRRSSHPLFLLVSPPFSCFSLAIIFLFLKQWLQKKVLKSTRNPLLLRYRIF